MTQGLWELLVQFLALGEGVEVTRAAADGEHVWIAANARLSLDEVEHHLRRAKGPAVRLLPGFLRDAPRRFFRSAHLILATFRAVARSNEGGEAQPLGATGTRTPS